MVTATAISPKFSQPAEIYGVTRQARVGSVIQLDGNRISERLLPGEPDGACPGWPGCDFRWPNPINEWRESRAIACNVNVTGRTLRLIGGDLWVRVQVEWVGDCEPSTFCGGWMLVS